MSNFPSAFLSYFAPSDFYDNRGKQAPLTRINVELPKELLEYSGTPPYNLQPIDPQIISNIQTAVLRQYGGVCRQSLSSFRQSGDLGTIDYVGRHAAIGYGVGMNYVSHLGNEVININVSPDAVRQLIGTEGDLCMLVLYKGNNILAIRMNDVYSGSFTPTYNKALHDSSWDSTATYTVIQEQLSASLSVMNTNLTLTDPAIVVGGSMLMDNLLTHKIDGGDIYLTGRTIGGVTNIYTSSSLFSFTSKDGFTFSGYADPPAGGQATLFISPAGTYVWGTFSQTQTVTEMEIFFHTIIVDTYRAHSVQPQTSLGKGSAPRYSPPTMFAYDTSLDKTTEEGMFSNEQILVLGSVITATIRVDHTVSSSSTLRYSGSSDVYTGNVNDPVVHVSIPHGGGSGDFVTVLNFPYAVSDKPWFSLTSGDVTYLGAGNTTDNRVGTFHTPYDTFPSKGLIVDGIWNLHDGGVLVQAVELTEQATGKKSKRVYSNGKRVEKIGGVSVDDIDAVFLNIPLKKIKEFK